MGEAKRSFDSELFDALRLDNRRRIKKVCKDAIKYYRENYANITAEDDKNYSFYRFVFDAVSQNGKKVNAAVENTGLASFGGILTKERGMHAAELLKYFRSDNYNHEGHAAACDHAAELSPVFEKAVDFYDAPAHSGKLLSRALICALTTFSAHPEKLPPAQKTVYSKEQMEAANELHDYWACPISYDWLSARSYVTELISKIGCKNLRVVYGSRGTIRSSCITPDVVSNCKYSVTAILGAIRDGTILQGLEFDDAHRPNASVAAAQRPADAITSEAPLTYWGFMKKGRAAASQATVQPLYTKEQTEAAKKLLEFERWPLHEIPLSWGIHYLKMSMQLDKYIKKTLIKGLVIIPSHISEVDYAPFRKHVAYEATTGFRSRENALKMLQAMADGKPLLSLFIKEQSTEDIHRADRESYNTACDEFSGTHADENMVRAVLFSPVYPEIIPAVCTAYASAPKAVKVEFDLFLEKFFIFGSKKKISKFVGMVLSAPSESEPYPLVVCTLGMVAQWGKVQLGMDSLLLAARTIINEDSGSQKFSEFAAVVESLAERNRLDGFWSAEMELSSKYGKLLPEQTALLTVIRSSHKLLGIEEKKFVALEKNAAGQGGKNLRRNLM